MKNIKSLLVYGFLIWLAPFVLSFFIFQLRESDRPFFETLMPIILVTTIMAVLVKYTQINAINSVREGLIVGFTWMALNLILDAFVFIWGPLKQPVAEYVKDIGLIYLIIPIITTAVAGIKNSNDKHMTDSTHTQ